VKTDCGHYFCEKCALEHDRKNQRCAVCEKDTRGMFNTADEITAKYKEKLKSKAKTVGGLGWGGWSTEEGPKKV
jgi:RING finger protein 113A